MYGKNTATFTILVLGFICLSRKRKASNKGFDVAAPRLLQNAFQRSKERALITLAERDKNIKS